MAAEGVLQSIWSFLGGEVTPPKPPTTRGGGDWISDTTAKHAAPRSVEAVAVEDLECELEKIESRIRRIQGDIARENELIRGELLPYAKQQNRIPGVVKINVNARINTRGQMEIQLRKMFVMRTKIQSHIYTVESAASQKLYTTAIRNTHNNSALLTTENDIRVAEDTIEQQRENEYRQREMDMMISCGTNIDEDDEGLEQELADIFAMPEMDVVPAAAAQFTEASTSAFTPEPPRVVVNAHYHEPLPVVNATPSKPVSSSRYRSKELAAFEDIM